MHLFPQIFIFRALEIMTMKEIYRGVVIIALKSEEERLFISSFNIYFEH